MTDASQRTGQGPLPSSTSLAMRCIAHIDMDCFYAQVEAVRLGIDCRTVPFVLGQWGNLIAINYPARRLGIGRFDSVKDAVEKCPTIYVAGVATYKVGENEYRYHPYPKKQTHKVSLEPYREASRRIFDIMRDTPGAKVEKGSVDEAYLDVTEAARVELAALRAGRAADAPPLTPEEALEPSTRLIMDRAAEMEAWLAERGASLATAYELPMCALKRGEAGEVACALEGSRCYSVGGAAAATAGERTAHAENSLLLCAASRVVRRIRDAIHAELHYDCSAGIAHNRLLAKCISATHKPNQQTLLFPDRAASALFDLKISELRGFGGKFGKAVQAVCGGVELCREAWLVPAVQFSLLDCETALLSDGEDDDGPPAAKRRKTAGTGGSSGNASTADGTLMSSSGLYAYYRARGFDDDTVAPRFFAKSLIASKNFSPSTCEVEGIRLWLVVLCSELAVRYEAFTHIFQVKGHNYNVKLGTGLSHIASIANRTVALPEVVSADSLLSAAVREVQAALQAAPQQPVNCVTVTIGNFTATTRQELKGQQQTLASFFAKKSSDGQECRSATKGATPPAVTVPSQEEAHSVSTLCDTPPLSAGPPVSIAKGKPVEVSLLSSDDDDVIVVD